MNIKVTKTKKPVKKSKSSNDLDIICRRLANIEAMISFLLEYLLDPDENNIKDEDNEDIKDEDNEVNEEEDCECECVHGVMIIDGDFKYLIKSPKGFSLWQDPTQLSGHIMYSTVEELEEISLCSSKQDLLDKGIPNKVLRAIKNDPLLGDYCNF